MSKHTVAALFFAGLALGVACVGLVLILSPAAQAQESDAQTSAEREPESGPPAAPQALPAVGSGGLVDAPVVVASAEVSRPGTRNELTPFVTSLVVTAVFGLLGWAAVRRWFPQTESGER